MPARGSPAAAFAAPVATKAKREAAFAARLDWSRVGEVVRASHELVIPALDLAAISRQYRSHGAAPVWKEATFQVWLDASRPIYEKVRDKAIATFIGQMAKLGWQIELGEGRRPRVSPGMYPAHDLRDNVALLDRRDFIVGAWFTFPSAKPLRIEVPAHLRDPKVIKR